MLNRKTHVHINRRGKNKRVVAFYARASLEFRARVFYNYRTENFGLARVVVTNYRTIDNYFATRENKTASEKVLGDTVVNI